MPAPVKPSPSSDSTDKTLVLDHGLQHSVRHNGNVYRFVKGVPTRAPLALAEKLLAKTVELDVTVNGQKGEPVVARVFKEVAAPAAPSPSE
jgi:hypothetical protein